MATYYWVGGTGDWDNTSTTHWAVSSGGVGGAGYPGAVDDVVFDSASSTSSYTVTLNSTGLGIISGGGSNNILTVTSYSGSILRIGTAMPYFLGGQYISGILTGSGYAGTYALSGGSPNGGFSGGWTPTLACRSLTISGPTSGAVTFAGGPALTIYGSLTIAAAGVIWTYSSALSFASSNTGNTITTNGVSLQSTQIYFIGYGGSWTLGSALVAGPFTMYNGTFNTANFNLTVGYWVTRTNQGTSARIINLGSSTITMTSTGNTWQWQSASTTLNAGTSTLQFTGSFTFDGAGLTYYNMVATTPSQIIIGGVNTFTNITLPTPTSVHSISFTANQTVNGTLAFNGSTSTSLRTSIQSSVRGTARTLTVTTVTGLSNIDFTDIAVAGASSPWSGTTLGNGGNNTNISFDPAKTVYWSLPAGGNWNSNAWALSSGGTPNVANFPLIPDTVIIDDAGLNTGTTISITSNYQIGTLDASSRSRATTLAVSASPAFFGNVSLSSSVATSSAGTLGFYGSGTQVLTMSGNTLTNSLDITKVTGSIFQLPAPLTISSSSSLILNGGVIDMNNFNLYVGNITYNSVVSTREIRFGTGEIYLTSRTSSVNVIGPITLTGTKNLNVIANSGPNDTRTISPYSTDDGNSFNIIVSAGSGTVYTGNSVFSCNNLTFTSGFTGSWTPGYSTIYGSLYIPPTLSVVNAGTNQMQFNGVLSGNRTITTSGKKLPRDIIIAIGSTSTIALQDSLTTTATNTITLQQGTLNTNNFNVSSGLFNFNSGNTKGLNLGTSTWTITGTGSATAGFYGTNVGTTYNTTNSNVVFASTSSVIAFNPGANTTFNNLTMSGNGLLVVGPTSGFLTINSLTNTVAPCSIGLRNSMTQLNLTNFGLKGSSGNFVSFYGYGTNGGTPKIISKSSGTVNTVALRITDINATGGAIWNAVDSRGINTLGWNFFLNSGARVFKDTGDFYINVLLNFDEVTTSTAKIAQTGVYADEFDEVTTIDVPFRISSSGTMYVSGIMDENTGIS